MHPAKESTTNTCCSRKAGVGSTERVANVVKSEILRPCSRNVRVLTEQPCQGMLRLGLRSCIMTRKPSSNNIGINYLIAYLHVILFRITIRFSESDAPHYPSRQHHSSGQFARQKLHLQKVFAFDHDQKHQDHHPSCERSNLNIVGRAQRIYLQIHLFELHIRAGSQSLQL